MIILFCNNLANPTKVDPEYQSEFLAVSQCDFLVHTLSYEDLCEGYISKSIKSIPHYEEEQYAIYRGWMFTGEQYESLYIKLKSRNIHLINTPEQYNKAHYFPESYKIIEQYTPKSVWIPIDKQIDFEQIFREIAIFKNHSIVLKDYVKSEKHHWETACFIPDASNKEIVKKVVSTFLELRGEHLNKGLVFRKFIEFEKLINHSKSNMPLTKEYRLFFYRNNMFFVEKYWNEGEYNSLANDLKNIPLTQITNLVSKIGNNFTTIDLAQSVDKQWFIVEVGDAQVSGLPESTNVHEFYKKLSTYF